MRVELTMDDEVWDIYRRESIDRRMPPGELIRERLSRAIALDPRTRAMVLPGDRYMQQLEEKLGGGQIVHHEDLLRKVQNLASIKFGTHEFQITPGQYRELAFRAQKTGRSIDQLIAEIYRRMQDTFWEYVP